MADTQAMAVLPPMPDTATSFSNRAFSSSVQEAVEDHVLILDLQHGVQQHILVLAQVLEAGDRDEQLQDQAGAGIDGDAPGAELEDFPAYGGDHLTFTPWQ